MKLLLTDLNANICNAWAKTFAGLPNVEIHNRRFEDMDFDIVSTAGNSYGIMDGGMDLSVKAYVGGNIEDRVQFYIQKNYGGEQPVGTSFCLWTPKGWVAHTPTMRLPSLVKNTSNAYLAMMGLLTATKDLNVRVIVPGFCALTGGMPANEVAAQMAEAYRVFLDNKEYPKKTWRDFDAKEKKAKPDTFLAPDQGLCNGVSVESA